MFDRRNRIVVRTAGDGRISIVKTGPHPQSRSAGLSVSCGRGIAETRRRDKGDRDIVYSSPGQRIDKRRLCEIRGASGYDVACYQATRVRGNNRHEMAACRTAEPAGACAGGGRNKCASPPVKCSGGGRPIGKLGGITSRYRNLEHTIEAVLAAICEYDGIVREAVRIGRWAHGDRYRGAPTQKTRGSGNFGQAVAERRTVVFERVAGDRAAIGIANTRRIAVLYFSESADQIDSGAAADIIIPQHAGPRRTLVRKAGAQIAEPGLVLN